MGTTITLASADGHSFTAYRAEPAGAPRAGIVVVQEIFGVNSHIRSVADGFAGAGYLAVAPALFDRVEPGIELGYEQADIERGIAIARGGGLEMGAVLADVAAAAAAAGAGERPVGIVGFCWGGLVTSLAAIRLPEVFAAAVAYYGGGTVTLIDQQPTVPLLMHFGEVDHAIPLDDVDRIRQAWPQATVVVHEGAQHGFNCDQRGSYNAGAAATAMDQTLAFFAEHLG